MLAWRSRYFCTPAASCCPASRCSSPLVPLLPRTTAEGAGSVQPWAGGFGQPARRVPRRRGKSSREAGRVFGGGLERQPLAPHLLQRFGQAAKVFLPWGSGSGELRGQSREMVRAQPRLQHRCLPLPVPAMPWATWTHGPTERPEQVSSMMLKPPAPQSPSLGEPCPGLELCYSDTNLPLPLGWSPGVLRVCLVGSHWVPRAAFWELQRSHPRVLRAQALCKEKCLDPTLHPVGCPWAEHRPCLPLSVPQTWLRGW